MKKYQLSNTSTSFKKFLDEQGARYELTADGKALFVWCWCDQDLFDLGKLYMINLNNG